MVDWDESEHPRWPAETPGGRGGEFRAASGGWVAAVATAIRSPEQDLLDLVTNNDVVKSSRLAGGQTAQTRLLTFSGPGEAKRVVHKRMMDWEDDAESMAAAEVVSAQIGRILGARVPVTIIDPDDSHAVYMEHLPGDTAWVAEGYGVDIDALHNTGEGRRLGLLDLLIMNQDRHGGNWLVAARGEVAGIDHGLADLSGGAGNWGNVESPFAYTYVKYDFEASGTWSLLPIEDLSRAEADQISAELTDLFDDDEFVRLIVRAGGTPKGLMERWQAIAAMAAG